MIENMMRTPFDGIGKPEKLKENLSGFISRRIDGKQITIISCRYHYQ